MPTTKSLGKPKQTEEAPEPATPKKVSLADVFDNTLADGTTITDGKYEAIIEEAVLQDPDEKGQSVRFTYRIVSGKHRGEELAQWAKLQDAEGNPSTKSIQIFRQGLAKLGYPDFKFVDLGEVLMEIQDQRTACLIQVKNKDGWTNAYIQGLVWDSKYVQEWLEENPS